MARLNIGNTETKGYVNHVDGNRVVIGTGSYTNKAGEKVFKESITVFCDDKFPADSIPAKGDYVAVSGDLVISPRKDKEGELQATYNIRFANQLVKTEAPKKAEAPAAADKDI